MINLMRTKKKNKAIKDFGLNSSSKGKLLIQVIFKFNMSNPLKIKKMTRLKRS
jgi:hypothetical protein